MNGMRLGAGHVVDQVRRFDVTSLLADGENEIRVTVDGGKNAGNLPFGVIAAVTHSGASGPSSSVVTDAVVAGDGGCEALRRSTQWSMADSMQRRGSLRLRACNKLRSIRPIGRRRECWPSRGIVPDFEGEGVRAIHRRDGNEDVYFIANREGRENAVTCAFRVSGKRPEWWDAVTGERRALGQFEEKDGRTFVPVRLAPHESGFIVFRNSEGATVRPRKISPRLRRCKRSRVRGRCRSIRTGAVPPTRGLIVSRTGQAAANRASAITRAKQPTGSVFRAANVGTTRALFLSLGSVHNIASVRLNGHDLGVVWCAPWRASLPANVLKTSGNDLEITVANLWLNRLIRDSGLPEKERLTWIPDKYPFQPNDPLQPSGLLGPVQIEAQG